MDSDNLAPQIKAIRTCLMCKKNFKSSGAGNRICGDCRHKQYKMQQHLDKIPLPTPKEHIEDD